MLNITEIDDAVLLSYEEALRRMVKILRDKSLPVEERMTAAEVIVNYAYGQPPQVYLTKRQFDDKTILALSDGDTSNNEYDEEQNDR